jgi:Ger(x)C family germination protein
MRKTKFIILVFAVIALMTLTGCWDSAEINDREYIFAVGIDETGGKLKFTAEIPKINEGEKQERLVYSEESDSFSNFYNKSFIRSDKVISDRLMQVIVLGEGTVRNKGAVKEIFDEIQRSPEINRRVKLALSKSSAESVIKTEIPNNPVVGRFMSEMLVKFKREGYQDIFTFDEAIVNLVQHGCSMVPLISAEKDSLKIDGAGVLKDYELKGYLNNEEVEIVMLLLDSSNSKIRNMSVEIDGEPISLGAVNMSISRDIKLNGDKLKADYYVTLYTYINSYTIDNKSFQDQQFLERIKQAAIDDINKRTTDTIVKLQKSYGTDLLKIRDSLHKYHKKDFEKVKDNYDKVFADAEINVHYRMNIKSVGMVK